MVEPGEDVTGDAVPLGWRFSVNDLPRLRELAAEWAAEAGLPPLQVGDFMLAVHEIAANAVLHGSPAAELQLRLASGGVEAMIRDGGHWVPSGRPATGPGDGLGMGLQVARQVCDEVDIRAGPEGTVVVLRMRLPG